LYEIFGNKKKMTFRKKSVKIIASGAWQARWCFAGINNRSEEFGHRSQG
jgi:hypothetical protein